MSSLFRGEQILAAVEAKAREFAEEEGVPLPRPERYRPLTPAQRRAWAWTTYHLNAGDLCDLAGDRARADRHFTAAIAALDAFMQATWRAADARQRAEKKRGDKNHARSQKSGS